MADGAEAAKVFSFYSQKYGRGRFAVPMSRVPYRTLYAGHAKAFDKLAFIAGKYGVDLHQYVKFYVDSLRKGERDVDADLISQATFAGYVAHLSAIEKRKRIYGWFMKSVDSLVELCLERNYGTTKEAFVKLVRKNRLGAWYVCGKISKYFLCAIPNFRALYGKLDQFARLDMAELDERFDMYNTEVNEAFLYVRHRKVNPFEVADEVLAERRPEYMRRQAELELFDPSVDDAFAPAGK